MHSDTIRRLYGYGNSDEFYNLFYGLQDQSEGGRTNVTRNKQMFRSRSDPQKFCHHRSGNEMYRQMQGSSSICPGNVTRPDTAVRKRLVPRQRVYTNQCLDQFDIMPRNVSEARREMKADLTARGVSIPHSDQLGVEGQEVWESDISF